MLISKGSRAHKRESRLTEAAERLPVICQLGGDVLGDSISHQQVQFLCHPAGLSETPSCTIHLATLLGTAAMAMRNSLALATVLSLTGEGA